MATNMKKVLLKKKIDGVIYDLYVKTSAELIQVTDSQTLTQKLAVLDADAADAKSKLAALLGDGDASSISGMIDSKVAALKKELTNESDATSLAGKIAKVASDLTAEAATARAAEKANADNITKLTTRVTTAEGKLTTLIGSDASKSVRTIANEELVKQLIPENASESLDSLKEIADWIQSHPSEASAMNTAISDLKTKVGTIPTGSKATTVVAYAKEVADAEATRAKAAEGTNATAAANAKSAADAAQKTADKAASDLAAEITRAKGAEGTNATAISTLDKKVGTIPTTGTGANSADVITYVKAMAADAKKAATDEATRAKAAEGTLTTAVNARARFLVSATQPADLTESDVWAQIIE